MANRNPIGPTEIVKTVTINPTNVEITSNGNENGNSSGNNTGVSSGNGNSSGDNTGVITGPFVGINDIYSSYDSYQVVVKQLIEFPTPVGAEIISPVYDIYIADSFGSELPFDGDATICFDITTTEDISKKRSCLSFFKETQEWECEDKCLERNDENQFCGSTSHFTAFAVLFYGIDGPGANCGSSPNNYIFDVYWKDLILIACFGGLAVCCFCIFALCGRCFCLRRLVFGKEGSRVLGLRHKKKKPNPHTGRISDNQI